MKLFFFLFFQTAKVCSDVCLKYYIIFVLTVKIKFCLFTKPFAKLLNLSLSALSCRQGVTFPHCCALCMSRLRKMNENIVCLITLIGELKVLACINMSSQRD